MRSLIAKISSSIAAKLSIIIVLMIVLITTLMGTVGYLMYRGDSVKANGERALAIAQSLASVIDGDEMSQIMSGGEKNEHWQLAKHTADKILKETGVIYLYVLGSDYSDTVTYFVEGYDPASGDEEMDLHATEDASYYADETFTTIRTGAASISEIYESGDYGMMLTASVPVLDSSNRVKGVVCADIALDQVMASVNSYGFQVIIIVLLSSVAFAFASVLLVRRSVGQPIEALTKAAARLARGDTQISLNIRTHDEIGRLANAFRDIADGTMEQANILEALADGDLTVRAAPRGPQDTMGEAIGSLTEQLTRMITNISQNAGQVSAASDSIARGAQSLSDGASEQNETVAQLVESIRVISEQAEQNNLRVEQAAALSRDVIDQAETGARQMERLTQAVREIEDANREISGVMRIIDDIASQTNILALNASIEAAHAGAHGAGFAIVAGEVRRLAVSSMESSREIAEKIDASIEKTMLGVGIAQETALSMNNIIQGVRDSSGIVSGIADSSAAQGEAIRSIGANVESVSQIVMQNSSTAEQSAAASQQMSGQAGELNEMLGRFRIEG